MKNLWLAIGVVLVTATANAQSSCAYVEDVTAPGTYILNGIASKYDLQKYPEFNWYNSSFNGYTVKEAYVQELKKGIGKINFLIFGGTWCSDTQFIVPKFFKLQEAAGIPDSAISFFAVDHQKKIIGQLTEVLNIKNVPTIIVFIEGKEMGRVVEYGTTGQWDKELVAIVTAALAE